jgi:hypothetical protein
MLNRREVLTGAVVTTARSPPRPGKVNYDGSFLEYDTERAGNSSRCVFC